MPKVSIIIPVYNTGQYLEETLQCLCKQTLFNIEILVTDDGSTDNSADIVRRMQQKDERIRYFYEDNQGQSAARNRALRHATGDYIYFMDSDDLIDTNALRQCYDYAESTQADFLFFDGDTLCEEGAQELPWNYKRTHLFEERKPYRGEELLSRVIDERKHSCVVWLLFIRRSYLERIKLLFHEGIIHEDMYWTYFLTKYTKAAAYCTKGVYHYFIHEGSIMTSVSKEMMKKRLSSRLWSNERFLEDAKRNGASQFQRQYITLNLLCCLVELNALKSLSEWLPFWAKVVSFGFSHITHFTLSRYIIYCCLLPPACFFAGKDNFRWRIQQEFVCNV